MNPKDTKILLRNVLIILCVFFLCVGCGKSAEEKLLEGQIEGSNVVSSLLFSDDFSDTSSGWDRENSDDGMSDYQDDQYHIRINRADFDVFANPYRSFGDVHIEVQATNVGEVADDNYGLICRSVDMHNFYAGLITSDGHYGIFKIKDGTFTLLEGDSMPTSPAILPAGEMNQIRLDCIGSRLTLSVNGIPLDTREDVDFPSGDVGLLAGSYAIAGVEIAFDNFMVFNQ